MDAWLRNSKYLMAAAPAPLSTPGLWLTGAERWLLLTGLAVALGGLAGRGLARAYKGEHPAPLPPPWALRGSLLGLLASAALLVTALAGPGLAARLAQPRGLGMPANVSVVIAGAELACFALAAVLLRLRQPGWSAVPLSGVVVAEGLRSHPEAIVPVAGAALTYCHLLPAVLWAGMLLYTLRTATAWRADPVAVRGIVRLYANVAAWLFAVVVITGVFSALLLVPVSSLLTTSYGRILVVKAALVAVTAGLAVAGRVWLRRVRPPGTGPALATKLECAALAAVLAVVGLLTVVSPPAKPLDARAAPPGAAAGHNTAAGTGAAAGRAPARVVRRERAWGVPGAILAAGEIDSRARRQGQRPRRAGNRGHGARPLTTRSR